MTYNDIVRRLSWLNICFLCLSLCAGEIDPAEDGPQAAAANATAAQQAAASPASPAAQQAEPALTTAAEQAAAALAAHAAEQLAAQHAVAVQAAAVAQAAAAAEEQRPLPPLDWDPNSLDAQQMPEAEVRDLRRTTHILVRLCTTLATMHASPCAGLLVLAPSKTACTLCVPFL